MYIDRVLIIDYFIINFPFVLTKYCLIVNIYLYLIFETPLRNEAEKYPKENKKNRMSYNFFSSNLQLKKIDDN